EPIMKIVQGTPAHSRRTRTHFTFRSRPGLAHRRGVDDAAVLVLRIEAALQADRRVGADELLEDLTVVADLLDDVVGPLVVDPQHLAHVPFGPEQAVDVRIA